MSHLVGNLKGRFSRDVAHLISACESAQSAESVREPLQVKIESPESDVHQTDPLYTGQPN